MLLMVMGLADVCKCGSVDNAPLSAHPGKTLHILDFQKFVFSQVADAVFVMGV